jgi:SnoaL-like domain
VWTEAWPKADTAAVAKLYAEDAAFWSQPYREREVPAEYAAWAFADQVAAECRFGTPVVQGRRAAVDWWGVVTSTDGSVETLAGTSLLTFDDSGLVVEQRDVWAAQAGRHELRHWAPES